MLANEKTNIADIILYIRGCITNSASKTKKSKSSLKSNMFHKQSEMKIDLPLVIKL